MEDVITKKDGFIFEENDYSCAISYQSKNKEGLGHEYPVKLGKLTKRRSDPPQWYISVIGSEYHPRNKTQGSLIVQTKEQGADLLLYLKETLIVNPLSDKVVLYLTDQWGELRKELEEANGRFYSIQRKRRLLSDIANANGLSFEFDGDINKEAKDLLDFVEKDLDSIYEHFGKDWARSFRARVQSLVQCVNPLAATDV